MTNVNTSILNLPLTVGSLTGDEYVPVVQGGTTKKTTVRNIGSAAITSNFPATIEFVMDGGGNDLTPGVQGYLQVPFDCTAQSVTLLADRICTIVADVWKCTQDEFDAGTTAPTSADSITGSNVPTITADTKFYSQALTTWTSSFGQGDVLAFNIVNNALCQRLTLSIFCERSFLSSS